MTNKKYPWIKIRQAELQKIERETGIPYFDLQELYIGTAKYLGPGYDCMALPLIRNVVEVAVENNVALWIVFKLKTRQMLPSDPNFVAEIYDWDGSGD